MDVWREISTYIHKGSWKNFILICKYSYNMNTEDEIENRSNHIWTIITMYPDKTWDWSGVSCNPNITWEIIETNPDAPWDWSCISRNPNITDSIIKNNPDAPWDWEEIECNPLISVRRVWVNPCKYKTYMGLSYSPGYYEIRSVPTYKYGRILPEYVFANHSDMCWDNIKIDPDYPWNWILISRNVTWEIIKNNPDIPWDWDAISLNPNITWIIIKDNPDKPWNWTNISVNSFNKKNSLLDMDYHNKI